MHPLTHAFDKAQQSTPQPPYGRTVIRKRGNAGRLRIAPCKSRRERGAGFFRGALQAAGRPILAGLTRRAPPKNFFQLFFQKTWPCRQGRRTFAVAFEKGGQKLIFDKLKVHFFNTGNESKNSHQAPFLRLQLGG
ncbi:MAG: hypothetical protein ACK4NS_13600, partial [Saprospiraceae bacterium]